MLYIIHTGFLLIWLIYIIKKEKYSWHTILITQFILAMTIDIIESFFCYFLGYYSFNTHLTNDFMIINAVGLIFTDGFILPFTGLILIHYATRVKNPWILPIVFSATFSISDLVYIKLGYLTYHYWSEWISFSIYFIFSCIFVKFAPRFMFRSIHFPYSLRIAAVTYCVITYIGAFISIFDLYQWTPLIVPDPGNADRVFDISISIIITVASAVCIPNVKPKFRPVVFLSFSILVIASFYYAYSQGWLVYHKWNHILTALYWLASFFAISLYDRWQYKYKTMPQN